MLRKETRFLQRIRNLKKFTKCHFSTAKLEKITDDNYKEFRKSAVTAINAQTKDRSILNISEKTKPLKRFRREFNLPQNAIDGLRNALITCERPAKQLQNEADQLANQLEQRRFPESPEKLKTVRNEIKRKLKSAKKNEDEDSLLDDDAFGGKIKEAKDYQLRNEVDKIMKKASFNWRPLEIASKEAAASYSLARLAPNYAEISRCLEEFSADPEFVPKTVLDYGSGCGAGFWAVTERWPNNKIDEITLVDTSDSMTRFAMDCIRKETTLAPEDSDGKPFVHDNVTFRRNLVPSLNTTYDLVIAHRTLCEVGSIETRIQLIESLWQRTNRYLVLIESAQPDAFSGILEARDFLLTSGTSVDYHKLFDILQERNCLTRGHVDTIENTRLSDFEKFLILRECVDSSITIPTRIPTATVMAPCPHDLGCPLTARQACTFSTRFRPIRADGRKSEREKDGTELSNFSFVILEKGIRKINTYTDRILKVSFKAILCSNFRFQNRKLGGHVTCDVCTAFRGIQRITLSKKKHDEMYSSVRSRRDGDVLPIKLKTIATEGLFDLALRD